MRLPELAVMHHFPENSSQHFWQNNRITHANGFVLQKYVKIISIFGLVLTDAIGIFKSLRCVTDQY
jgi:hypothetical protein